LKFVINAALLLLTASFPLFAQQYSDIITVNVVEVPVYVERFGAPVAGLTRDDFELFVDGKPRTIEYFDVIEESDRKVVTAVQTAPAAAPTPAELKRRRLFLLLFDIGGSSPRALHRARQNALKFLAESEAGDTYAVATIGTRGMRFVVPFTTDRVAIRRSIGTLAPSADPFQVATRDVERIVWHEAIGGAEAALDSDGDVEGGASRLFGGSMKQFMDPVEARENERAQEIENEEQGQRDRRFTRSLGDLAERLAPLSGVKHVVLLTEREMKMNHRLINLVVPMHERYREAGVILDAVDIRLPFVPGMDASKSRPTLGPTLLPPNVLYTLSLGTGGSVAGSLRSLQQNNAITYVLGFSAARTATKTSSIRVRVKNQPMFTEVRYRRSYSNGPRAAEDNSLFLADTLLNDIPQGGVTLDLDVKGAWIAAKIPGVELLAQSSDKPLALDVFLYVFDQQGQTAAWHQLRIDVDLVAGRDFLSANPYTIRKEFNLPPGHYSAKAIVRIAGTDMTGFRRTDFVVP
jgi:VWFA-related protein